MRQSVYMAVVLLTMLGSGASCARAPVLGGPCEGCELVFEGLPTHLEARARIAPLKESGEPLVIEGAVRTKDGTPAPGVIVYAYHTDAAGIYPKSATMHGRLRGWARTDRAGRYRFDTIRPGAYPARDNPQHVHMHVLEPGKGTYYIDEMLFDDDPLLTPARRKALHSGRGGAGLTFPRKDAQGVWHVRRDIVLGAGIPGYP